MPPSGILENNPKFHPRRCAVEAQQVLLSPTWLVAKGWCVTASVSLRCLSVLTTTLVLVACGGGGNGGGGKRPDVGLASLVLDHVTLVPAFTPTTLTYHADVANSVLSTTVTPVATTVNASITVDGVVVPSGNASAPVALVAGDNVITVSVVAQDGTTRTYTVTLTRNPSNNANLSALSLSVTSLDQRFQPSLTHYTAATGFFGTSTLVRATAEHAGATLGLSQVLPEPRSSDGYVELSVGTTTLRVVVTAEDGVTTQTYSIAVERATILTAGQQAYVKAINTDQFDGFGWVALSGDLLAVGAGSEDSAATGIDGDSDDNSRPNAGAVYLYEREGDVWQFRHYVKATNPDEKDLFGARLALDGDTLAISAFWEQSLAPGVDGDQLDNSGREVGAVYVLRRDGAGTWRHEAYLKASTRMLTIGLVPVSR